MHSHSKLVKRSHRHPCLVSWSVGTLLATTFYAMGWVETKRWWDLKNPGSQADGSFLGVTEAFKGKENGYPGELPILAPQSAQARTARTGHAECCPGIAATSST